LINTLSLFRLPCEILALLNSEGLFNRGHKHYFTGVLS